MNEIYEEYVNFMNDAKSVYISSVNDDADPEISYSPCIVDDDKHIYILVSTLSKRTKSLLAQRNVSLMFIEPEEQCEQIYVRTRLIFLCNTLRIDREMGFSHLLWDEKVAQFTAKFGDIISMLVSLDDFKMFRFIPIHGTFVKGFGKAYTIEGQLLDNISHISFSTGEKM